ncbi:MAG: hypothetical protein LUE86_03745 [Clostridiales bacterium]|nr:hypothetical protein [Clostridiales bacterium]
MAKNKNKKIVRYRHPLNINIGMIIFAIIFIYIAFSIYSYVKRDKIQFYEVAEGNIVNDRQYTGLILRDEQVQSTDRAGYINYYVREGKRAAVGTSIYSIDETGSLSAYLQENPEANVTLTDANLSDIKRQLASFVMSYDDDDFSEIYNLQYSLEAAVLEYVNFNMLGSLETMLSESGASFQQVKAPVSGVVSYSIDGYEGMDASSVKASSFDRSGYTRAITKSGQLIEKNAPVYKLVTSDDWSIVFPLSEEEVAEYADRTSLHVTFESNDLESDASFSILSGADQAWYGKLDFHKYMVPFITDRFVSFEIETEKITGLKIPVTAVTTKNFYLVPVDYLANGGDSSDPGFYKEIYTENGTQMEFVPTTIYYSTDEYYYIDMGDNAPFADGDYIVKADSQDRFQIGRTAMLEGVYNINKGYAVFKQIEILKSNDEYYTVRKGTSYGLSVYDHIVLEADTVYEGQLIYQ